jgi:apolipoprotein N-acyltransferase
MEHDKKRWHRNARRSAWLAAILSCLAGYYWLNSNPKFDSYPGTYVALVLFYLMPLGGLIFGMLVWAIVYAIGDTLVERRQRRSREGSSKQ